MVTLLDLPLEITTAIADLLSDSICNCITSDQISPLPTYSLSLTNKKLYDIFFPRLFRNICIAVKPLSSNRVRSINSLIVQLQRQEIAALVQSLCLHLYTSHNATQFIDGILRPELCLRSLCITRHLGTQESHYYNFNFSDMVERYHDALEELHIDLRWDVSTSDSRCNGRCPDMLCRTPFFDELFGCALFQRLRHLSMHHNLFFQYTAHQWIVRDLSREDFWLPESLEILDLHYDELCDYSEATSDLLLKIDFYLNQEGRDLCRNILRPCYQSERLHLKTLFLTFDMAVSDLQYNETDDELDAVYGPRAWLKWFDKETSSMGVQVLVRLLEEPDDSAYRVTPLCDVRILSKTPDSSPSPSTWWS